MAEEDHNGVSQVELAPGDGCVIVRADGGCEFVRQAGGEDEPMGDGLVLLAALALGMGVRDQWLIDLLAQFMAERG